MKRIYFNHLNSKGNILLLFIAFVAFMTTILSTFEWITLEQEQSKAVFLILLVILIYRSTPEFIFKNYVQWNQHGIIIKIDSWKGMSFNFQNITHVDFKTNAITINTSDKRFDLDLRKVNVQDQEHLKKILRENTNNNFITEHLF